MWAGRFESPSFRFDLSRLMLDAHTGEIAGYLLAHVHERDVYLMTIATRREYRRRGVAAALIAASLAEATRQGFKTASLNVDTENPTGALRVYQRSGFTVKHRSTGYCRRFSAER
jgi:mycothiol synthase